MEFILENDVEINGVLWQEGTLCTLVHTQIDGYNRELLVVLCDEHGYGIFVDA